MESNSNESLQKEKEICLNHNLPITLVCMAKACPKNFLCSFCVEEHDYKHIPDIIEYSKLFLFNSAGRKLQNENFHKNKIKENNEKNNNEKMKVQLIINKIMKNFKEKMCKTIKRIQDNLLLNINLHFEKEEKTLLQKFTQVLDSLGKYCRDDEIIVESDLEKVFDIFREIFDDLKDNNIGQPDENIKIYKNHLNTIVNEITDSIEEKFKRLERIEYGKDMKDTKIIKKIKNGELITKNYLTKNIKNYSLQVDAGKFHILEKSQLGFLNQTEEKVIKVYDNDQKLKRMDSKLINNIDQIKNCSNETIFDNKYLFCISYKDTALTNPYCLIKLDLESRKTISKNLKIIFPKIHFTSQIILLTNSKSLYAIFSTNEFNQSLIINKLHIEDLILMEQWITNSEPFHSYGDKVIIDDVLYCFNNKGKRAEISSIYSYDMKIRKERKLNLSFSINEPAEYSISCTDKNLYAYSNKEIIKYDLEFDYLNNNDLCHTILSEGNKIREFRGLAINRTEEISIEGPLINNNLFFNIEEMKQQAPINPFLQNLEQENESSVSQIETKNSDSTFISNIKHQNSVNLNHTLLSFQNENENNNDIGNVIPSKNNTIKRANSEIEHTSTRIRLKNFDKSTLKFRKDGMLDMRNNSCKEYMQLLETLQIDPKAHINEIRYNMKGKL
jgi:hypothetical protein